MGKKPASTEPVTVFISSNSADLMIAKSLLEAENIYYYAKGEGVQDFFAGGRIGGFNPIVGPVQIQVAAVDNKAAIEILRDMEADQDDA